VETHTRDRTVQLHALTRAATDAVVDFALAGGEDWRCNCVMLINASFLCRVAALTVVALAGAVAEASAQPGYQWAVPIARADGKEFTAYLWIAPQTERIRGLLVGERDYIANDPAIRAAAADEKLAVILLRPHFDALFRYWENDSPLVLQTMLERLAEVSGYREIAVAPLFPFGHSVSSVYASHVAYWNSDRVFGLLAFKGALVEPPQPDASVAGVPALVITGQFEEFGPGPHGVLRDWEDRETGWRVSRERYMRMRERDERNLICFAVDAGSTHMAWSPRNGELTGLFIRKAAAARIPDWPVDAAEPVGCREVDVATGWLTSGAIHNPALMRAAAYADYKGSKTWTWWHADEELAAAWTKYHHDRFAKRTQYVTFTDPATGRPIYSRHDLRYVIQPHWIGPDTFRVAGGFLMEVRDRYAPPEPPLGHADEPIRFSLHRTSDFAQAGPDTFRVVRYGARDATGHVLAYHDGNHMYRRAEQPASMRIPWLTKGEPHTLSFPALSDMRPGDPPAPLTATSDRGLPVTYTVDHGPATIVDGNLALTPIPPRANLPLEIQVTAYQWGSAVEPFVQTAQPVTRRLRVNPR
jgi:hypothetical protein